MLLSVSVISILSCGHAGIFMFPRLLTSEEFNVQGLGTGHCPPSAGLSSEQQMFVVNPSPEETFQIIYSFL